MQLARIVGHAVSHIYHPSLRGWRLLIAQPLDKNQRPDGEPLLVIDQLGASIGSLVILSNDGQGARELVRDPNSPVRWFVLGLPD
ncbi:MAG: EutN/CcmL family microcompartment protein [Gemmatales bacterium]|nr:EutN/CcmL family microcompartment protein [Gemmatales bacterium]MDW7995056.1 EutN/CcmL family microcompartment protein [Gemmatales bacterium]